MKTSLLLIFMFSLLGIQSPGELTVTVSNIYPVEGEIYVAVYNHREYYLDEEFAVFRKVVIVEDSIQNIVFKDVPDGNYAIAIFQDLDGNKELSTSIIGIPREPYGFSNNARGTMGPPRFEKAQFSFTGNMVVEIALENDKAK